MEFEYVKDLDSWKSKCTVLNTTTDFQIISPDIRKTYSKYDLASIALNRISKLSLQLEKHIVEFAEYYNDCWADPDDDMPTLSTNEFVLLVKLDGVVFDIVSDIEDTISLYYECGHLFGGGGIELTIDESENISATTIG
ncbi:hypothetical protein CW745_16340 [Psychromonas sp. psych-6C06]|uniref:DUF2262 domain-containing protein n=1 Tax=Psychromonas sp. psych-6C06 TaxID=2058089 RepID=UPI000C31D297|nr:DUF2262 domain-containing protein [Psychromonas sp. psych-6C06]PKF60184.1 hypothetical protein CW745_16340 [Psychromonas sp. psych-6C06]